MDISSIIINLSKLDDGCSACGHEPCVCVADPTCVADKNIAASEVNVCGVCDETPCVCAAPDESNIAAQIAELSKLARVVPVKESLLKEITNVKAPVMDALHRLGQLMLKKAEHLSSQQSHSDPETVDALRHMSRLGGMLVDLGGPEEEVPLEKFSRPDLEFIAIKLNIPLEKFMNIVGIHEGVEMIAYQEENDLEPMSKKQVMGDQPLVNNTGDNSMVDAKHPVKKLAVKTVKESMDAIREMEVMEEQFQRGDEVRVASDNMYYGDECGKVEDVNQETGVVTVYLDQYGYVDLKPNDLHKEHDNRHVFEDDVDDTKYHDAIAEAVNNFSMEEFLEHSGEDLLWNDRGHKLATPEDFEFSTQTVLDLLKSYLTHWVNIHTDLEDFHPDNITDHDVKPLFNETVLPFLTENGYKITPALNTVEGAMCEADVCPECKSEPCQCDDVEKAMTESNKDRSNPKEVARREKRSHEKFDKMNARNKGDKEELEEGFTYGDKVVITGDKHHLGDEGEVVSIDKENGKVVVDMDGHGRHSFPIHNVMIKPDDLDNNEQADWYDTSMEAAPTPDVINPPEDLHGIAREIAALDDNTYNDVILDLFGYTDPERIISEQHIVDQLTSLGEDELIAITSQLWIPEEGEVDEGNAHDDLRAMKSDHDTLMNKNIADAGHEHILDEVGIEPEGHWAMNSGKTFISSFHEAKDLTDKILRLDDKTYIEVCKMIFPTAEVHKPHDKTDVLTAINTLDEQRFTEVKNFLNKHESVMSDVGDDSDHAIVEAELEEKSAPGQEAWIKAHKADFIKEYGKKKGLEVLYATAYKRADESIESLATSLNEEFDAFEWEITW